MQAYPKSYVRKDGYRMVYLGCVDGQPRFILEHRLVVEAILGRTLKRTEIVHHIDGDKLNNSPSNLEVMTRYAHTHHHAVWEVKRSQVDCICHHCGTTYSVQTYRKNLTKYCSEDCKLAAIHESLRVVRPSTPCLMCGTMIEGSKYRKKYCSDPCRAIGRGQSVSAARQQSKAMKIA